MEWIKHSEKKPTVNQQVIYYFHVVGVHRGTYYGKLEYGITYYGSSKGFLGDDVTHWQPDEGQDLPEPPPADITVNY